MKTKNIVGIALIAIIFALLFLVLSQESSKKVDVIESGEVVVDLKMRTTTKGLWAAGDIRIDAAKQVVCAAGDGAPAAVDIIEYLG